MRAVEAPPSGLADLAWAEQRPPRTTARNRNAAFTSGKE